MRIRFWGVRGSIAVSGKGYQTGGNTSCLEIEHEGERLILDAGTGLRALGEAIGFMPTRATLLFSHLHWDHIQGFPFFAPAYHPGSQLTLGGPDQAALAKALDDQMRPPTFPITLDTMPASLDFVEIRDSAAMEIGPFRVLPLCVDHPGGVLAYRIEAGGRSAVYATDIEHGDALDARLIALSEGADLLVHDAQYTREEYQTSRRGWGHSPWNDAVEVARQAAVGRLALFHHDPGRRDGQVDWIEDCARGHFSETFAAREGLTVAL